MKVDQKGVFSHRLCVAAASAMLMCPVEARVPSAELLDAIRMVESENGRTSRNQYQIRDICVCDVNRIYGTGYRHADVFDPEFSRRIVSRYLDYWSERYRDLTGRAPTDEVLARIHNGGPNGWRRRVTEGYWKRVSRAMGGAR